MCEYCDGSKKPIETEFDGEAYITITPNDSEYPENFVLDVYKKLNDGLGDTWMYFSFIVLYCPMCGCNLSSDA